MPSYRGAAANVADQLTFDVDCPAVARMKEHGSIIMAKNTMCDFGMLAAGYSSHHGITRNPWNLAHSTGGSSSGSGATIAAGINAMALGTDIVGSIRLPASFCGLFGHKPSQGRVPYYFPNTPTLVAGPMSRTVADSALMMNVITEADERDFTALKHEQIDYLAGIADDKVEAKKRGKIGLIRHLGFRLPGDQEVMDAVAQAAQHFASLGFDVEEIPTPFTPEDDACAGTILSFTCIHGNEYATSRYSAKSRSHVQVEQKGRRA